LPKSTYSLSNRLFISKKIVLLLNTLHAKTKKGNRPSYYKSSQTRPEQAIPLYKQFKDDLSIAIGKPGEIWGIWCRNES
jgi:D-Tyr-tRNAtyr deacylase